MKRALPPWSKEVKKSLIDKDMSVTELSAGVGMARGYVSRVVSGSIYAPECANRINSYLGITTQYDHRII